MAHLATPLAGLSVRSLDLLNEDKDELQALGFGSIKLLMDALDENDGDLTKISSIFYVIEPAQSDRIGDAVLADPRVPAEWKAKYQPSNQPSAPQRPAGNNPRRRQPDLTEPPIQPDDTRPNRRIVFGPMEPLVTETLAPPPADILAEITEDGEEGEEIEDEPAPAPTFVQRVRNTLNEWDRRNPLIRQS